MAPHQHLSRRAEITVAGWTGILFLIVLVPGGIFCIVAAVIIWRRKRAQKERQRKLSEEQEHYSLMAQERLVQETWAREDFRGDLGQGREGPIELQGGVVDHEVQQLDGFAAPAMTGYDGKPLELPAQTVVR
ncbi:hypothetical protein CC86DRAFT_44027 [Ophiobolus disseminans]|uniref:Uncharacterized protein n=1 Tax=Ophiobolus disseminans TaxID=1469910 RepID=A0A6A6ZYK4_9PLEO|nr:hypothetical protein CC86DRAFT_44027 [Ophiobolus disseminans]